MSHSVSGTEFDTSMCRNRRLAPNSTL